MGTFVEYRAAYSVTGILLKMNVCGLESFLTGPLLT